METAMQECCSKTCGDRPDLPDPADAVRRSKLVQRALRLAMLTVGWNVVEGLVAVSAALAAGSVALLGFGLDSFVETASGGVMVWRLGVERRGAVDAARIEHVEERARKLVSASLFLLAAWIVIDAGKTLWLHETPHPTKVGIGVTALSLVVMMWLARAKRQVAAALESRALSADAFQTTACWWLSLTTLVGIVTNAAFGWWWADPAAALGVTYFLGREARAAWRGDDCCP